MASPKYRLQEPFYDNLVLWQAEEEIDWDGLPTPTMIPLNDEARDAMAKYMASLGRPYTPPLSEQPDTLDGKHTVAPFEPGDRRSKGKAAIPPFAVTPGRKDSPKKGARRSEPLAPELRELPTRAPKNFNRESRDAK